jgi:hypothetical protein
MYWLCQMYCYIRFTLVKKVILKSSNSIRKKLTFKCGLNERREKQIKVYIELVIAEQNTVFLNAVL